MIVCFLLSLVFISIQIVNGVVSIPSSFTLGVSAMMRNGILPSDNRKYIAAIMMAIDEINNKTDGVLDNILPSSKFRFYFREDINDFTYGTLNAYFNLIFTPSTIASIGPMTTVSGQGTLPVYAASKVPVIGYHNRSPYFADSSFYPNYLRTVPGYYQDGQVTASLIAKYFQWDKVSVFYTPTQAGRTSAQVFRYYALQNNIQVFSYHNLDSSENNLIGSIYAAKKFGAKIFVVFVEPELAFDLLEQGYERGLFSSNTQIIGGEILSTTTSWNSLNTTSTKLNNLLKGFIGVKYNHEIPSSDLKEKFISRWLKLPSTAGVYDSVSQKTVCNTRKDSFGSGYIYQFNPAAGPGSPIPGYSTVLTGTCAGVNFPSYASHPDLEHELDDVMYAYDSVLAVALGLHHLIYEQNILSPTPSQLNKFLLNNFTFTGITGQVSFNTAMEDESFDIGGRIKDLRYDIVNYVPFNNPDHNDRNLTFSSIIQWHSEKGFTTCLNQTTVTYVDTYSDDFTLCENFKYASLDNSVPLDSPKPNEKGTPSWINEILRLFSFIGLVLTFLVIFIIFLFRQRRLVKMSQPIIANLKRVGMMLGFIRVMLYAMETKNQICYARLWFEHIAFQLIFCSILVRSGRVYLVTCALKRVKVTDIQCVSIILTSIIITIGLLSIITSFGVTLKHYVVVEDQFSYNFQKTCQYHNQNVLLLMYIYDLLILILSLVICWLIRKVNSTISNTAALVEGLLTTTIAIIGLSILVGLTNLTPGLSLFVIGLTISLILLRLLWIFDSKMIFNLMIGYELDRALILRKSEKNILQLLGCVSLSSKIFTTDENEIGNKSGYSGTQTSMSRLNSRRASLQQSQILEKYSKLKVEELVSNVNLIKEDLELKLIELASLENLIFLASQEDDSAASNVNNTTSTGGGLQNHYSNHSESNQQPNEIEENEKENEKEEVREYGNPSQLNDRYCNDSILQRTPRESHGLILTNISNDHNS